MDKRLFLLAIIPAVFYGGYMALPRGIRNKNPGNIRHGDNWVGMAPFQTDKSFVRFSHAKYGIRAMARILKTYARQGVYTLGGIVSRWAPPVENDTESYIRHVEKQTGLRRNHIIVEDQYPEVIAAIIKHENGIQPYSIGQIREGVSLA